MLDICLVLEKQKSQITFIKTNINFVYILYIWNITEIQVFQQFLRDLAGQISLS